MEEYQVWRQAQGLARATPKYPKRSRPFFVSDNAFEGLHRLAEQFGLMHGTKPSASGLVEAIGLNTILVYQEEETDSGYGSAAYVDTDGLTVSQCFELGKEDYIEKRPMAFSTSALAGGRKRSRVFVEAYVKGYTTGFIDDEVSYEPNSFEALFETNTPSNE